MPPKNYVCWKCGGKLPSYCLPIRHYDLCPHCREDLHTCRMCRSFAPHASGKCSKEEADYVSNKERANYCHYFSAKTNAHKTIADPTKKAIDELSSLFAPSKVNEQLSKDFQQHAQEAKSELHSLFGEEANQEELSAEEKARRELEALFGKPKS